MCVVKKYHVTVYILFSFNSFQIKLSKHYLFILNFGELKLPFSVLTWKNTMITIFINLDHAFLTSSVFIWICA